MSKYSYLFVNLSSDETYLKELRDKVLENTKIANNAVDAMKMTQQYNDLILKLNLHKY